MIKSSADGLLTLINDILDFSKIEAGKMELSCVDFDLRSAVEDVVDDARAQGRGQGAGIRVPRASACAPAGPTATRTACDRS